MEDRVSLGEMLKKRREEKNLTIEDVVRITKIRKEFLIALEEECYDQLPERTYSLGYFRGYARFLEIDNVEGLVVKLDEIYSFDSPKYIQKTTQISLEEEYSLINTLKKKISKDSSNDTIKEPVTNKNYVEEDRDTSEKFSSNNATSASQKKLLLILLLLFCLFLFLGYTLLADKFMPQEDDNMLLTGTVVEEDPKNMSLILQDDFVIVENDKNTTDNKVDFDNEEFMESEVPAMEIKISPWPKVTRDYQISIAFSEDVWVQIYNKDDPTTVYLDRLFRAGTIYDVPMVSDISMRVGNYKGVKVIVDSKEITLTSNKKNSVVLGNIVLEKDSLLNTYPLSQ